MTESLDKRCLDGCPLLVLGEIKERSRGETTPRWIGDAIGEARGLLHRVVRERGASGVEVELGFLADGSYLKGM
jgi:hypothetical protein